MYVCIKFLQHDSATHIILIIQTELRKNYDSFPYLPYVYFLFFMKTLFICQSLIFVWL